ncbi:MAG: hypothetical protein AB7U46_13550, partial [Paenirhodobacter sp.]|uniref:hypothetical protein n=1 Tax=Paenirhodobacter sp. TaxID=1965326 RepID=UPI003D0F8C98
RTTLIIEWPGLLRGAKSGKGAEQWIVAHLGLICTWKVGEPIPKAHQRERPNRRGSLCITLSSVQTEAVNVSKRLYGGHIKQKRRKNTSLLPSAQVMPLDNGLRARFLSVTASAALHIPQLLQYLFLGFTVRALIATI